MMEIPEELKTLLNKYQITDVKILEVNERKGRWDISGFTIKKQQVFIKWNQHCNELEYNWLQLENSIYKDMDNTFSVKYFPEFPFFSVEYINNCKNFREVDLSDCTVFEIIMDNFVENYVLMHHFLQSQKTKLDIKATDIEAAFLRDARTFFGKLLYSGPLGTKGKRYEKLLNKVVGFLFKHIIRIHFMEFCPACLSVIHGDLHLGNIILDDTGRMYIIDFENVRTGVSEFDILYCYAQIYELIKNLGKRHIDLLNKGMNKLIEQLSLNTRLFWGGGILYRVAIIHNSRFHINEEKADLKDKISTIKKYFEFFRRK